MKKFYAKLVDRDNAVLIEGDYIQTDDSLIYVFYQQELTGIFDRNAVLYCHLTEQKGRDDSGQADSRS